MDFTKIMPRTIDQLRNLYESTSSGNWFSPDTMRFFKTRLLGDFKRLSDKCALFITTEKGPTGVRKASIRIAIIQDMKRDETSDDLISKISISTYDEFNNLTIAQARRELNKIKMLGV